MQRYGLSATALIWSLALTPVAAWAQDPMLLVDNDGLQIRGHFQAGVNGVIEQNLFWNYADTIAPAANFNSDTQWLEGYIKPGISFSKEFNDAVTAYGKASLVASGTLGTDSYDASNTGAITLEEGYIGLRTSGSGATFDISVGPREFKAGTGMLLANGGTSGFDRGALKLGPRKAWGQAVLASVKIEDFTGTAFFLDPNELPDSDSGTKIVGADLRYDAEGGDFAGATLGHVLESRAPYPKAAPGGIGVPSVEPGAREGLNFVSLYGRTNPLKDNLPGLYIGGDFAYEWNERIDMQAWGGRAQIGYTFADMPWTPTIGYAYQTFSGDDPNTSRQERFDPLFFEGSPSSWSTGSKSSMVFINSNVNAHQFSLKLLPSERDTITLRYSHISANELLSPVQFGQGTRIDVSSGVPNPVGGVTNAHLSDDFFIEYGRVLTPNAFLTAGLGMSFPGAGIDSVTTEKSPIWSGGFVNVVINF